MIAAEDRAELDELYAALGFTTVERSEMLDELDEIAALPVDDPQKVLRFLAESMKLLPFLEADVRAWGHTEFADELGRFAAAMSLWLELPPGLALLAGLPTIQIEGEKP